VWLSKHTSTVNYLKINIPKRLKADDNVPRAGAIRSAKLRSVFKENYKKPYYLEDFPGGKEGVELLEWFTPETRTRFLEEVRRLKILPRKQYQVLELGLKGKGDAEIGHELGIETSTVQSHRSVALKQPRLLLLAKKWRKKRL
jgi:DNA-directed RNA polymerase specialized sigma24 family protein